MKLTVPSGVSVILPDNVRDKLFTLCETAFPDETGGIIYGCYTNNNLCASITGITAQTSDSCAGRTWFHRGIDSLQNLLNDLWHQRLHYLGEWHFHPNGSPQPSGRDLNSLRSIAGSLQSQCSHPIMLIVGGTTSTLSYRIYLVNADGEYVEATQPD